MNQELLKKAFLQPLSALEMADTNGGGSGWSCYFPAPTTPNIWNNDGCTKPETSRYPLF